MKEKGFNLKEKISERLRPTDVEVSSNNTEENNADRYDELVEYNEKYPEPTAEDYTTLPKVLGHALLHMLHTWFVLLNLLKEPHTTVLKIV